MFGSLSEKNNGVTHVSRIIHKQGNIHLKDTKAVFESKASLVKLVLNIKYAGSAKMAMKPT